MVSFTYTQRLCVLIVSLLKRGVSRFQMGRPQMRLCFLFEMVGRFTTKHLNFYKTRAYKLYEFFTSYERMYICVNLMCCIVLLSMIYFSVFLYFYNTIIIYFSGVSTVCFEMCFI